MRVGFKQETEESLEPDMGTADVNETEEDDNVWFEFFFPKVMDFFMIYGAVSFVKNVIEYVKQGGNNANV